MTLMFYVNNNKIIMAMIIIIIITIIISFIKRGDDCHLKTEKLVALKKAE